ncbi:hypothetical protein CIY_04450 [Butyrivibrio fibrisolvens 16/4]|nr:hypothetical protein CIY_04450 [Butyrivibrio fibrisolvens 16/4]
MTKKMDGWSFYVLFLLWQYCSFTFTKDLLMGG